MGQNANRRMRRALGVSLLLAPAALFVASPARPQSPARVARLGYLDSGWANPESQSLLDAFRRGLRELGYTEGRNLAIEYRWAEGRYERLPELARELAGLKLDVLVVGEAQAARAARRATRELPIVMVAAVDPVGFGLVKSLARPGENLTGLANLSPELTAKHLELLKETAPAISRVAVLWNAANPIEVRLWRARQVAARALGLSLISIEVRSPDDLAPELAGVIVQSPQALHLFADPVLHGRRGEITAFAAKHRLPIVCDASDVTDAGGLMSYGVYLPDLFHRAARFVGRILKGRHPSELPVEQPTRFELVINLRTARSLGLAISPSILVLADRVIE
jgi:putative ABC transport system substrate-binding protein